MTAAGTVTYTLTVANNGPSDAAAVSVLDTLPAGVTFVSAAGTGWTCTNVGNVSVTCTRPTLATGVTAPVITVVVTAPAAVRVADQQLDGVLARPQTPTRPTTPRRSTTGVTASADVAITKTGPATVAPAARSPTRSSWPTTARPTRPTCPSSTPSRGVTFVSATGTGWTCTNTGNVSVTCTRAALADRGDRPDDHRRRHGAGAGGLADQHRYGDLDHQRPRRRPTTPPR